MYCCFASDQGLPNDNQNNHSLNQRHNGFTFRFSLPFLTKAFLKDLPEMKPVDREGNGLRKEAGTVYDCPEQ